MATNKVTPRTSEDKTSTPNEVPPKMATPEETVSNGSAAIAKGNSATKAKRLPAATIRAMMEH
jgi:hypothetical protein